MNNLEVKQRNRTAILTYIIETGQISRKDIADAMGLTPAAVTQITSAMLEHGILKELGRAESSGVGRKKVLLDINYDFAYLYAINMEPESVTVALCNLKGDAVGQKTFSIDAGMSPARALKKIAGEAKALSAAHAGLPITGVSVGITGIVDKARGHSVHAYGIWDDEVDVEGILKKELSLPVVVENNVNALALAELCFGFGKKFDNILLIKWGPGVGSSLIINKKLYEGTDRKAAELGHYIVEKNGAKCSCGRRGCLETKVSYHALQRIRRFDIGHFGEVAEADDRLKDALDLFARCVVNTITIAAPDRVILCGSLFRDASVRRELIDACKAYDGTMDGDRILYTDFGEREGYIGPVATFLKSEMYLRE